MAMYHECFWKESLISGPGKMVTLRELKQGAVLATKFLTVLSTSVCSAKWIKYQGTQHRCDFIICTKVRYFQRLRQLL